MSPDVISYSALLASGAALRVAEDSARCGGGGGCFSPSRKFLASSDAMTEILSILLAAALFEKLQRADLPERGALCDRPSVLRVSGLRFREGARHIVRNFE